ncbi:ribonuclease H-like domain-containing protein [Flagelloscypha sp. PMI_526]|nr:ribonuclease H-like domain-containing protein [Flagelloscypha sp. PMI_526]
MLKAKGKKGAFFAVHKGKTPGIYLTWDECKEQTNGFTGAVHKKFSNRAEAEAFVRNGLGASGSTSAQVDYKGKKRAASPDSKGGPSDEDCFVVYCDGACSNNQDKDKAAAGSGVWWGHNDSRNWSGRVPGDQTNNRGEFLAVLHILENEPIGTKPLKIKTDSKYVIDSLTKWFQGWSNNNWKTSSGKPVANAGIVKITAAHLQRRNKLGQKVHFEHVKGHAGIEGNEAADRLAVAACTLPVPIERDWDTEASRLEKENAIPLKGKLDIEVYDEDNDLASEPVTGDNDTLKPSSTRNIAEGSPAKRRRVEAPTTPSVSLLSPIKHPCQRSLLGNCITKSKLFLLLEN